ncbi:MAG: peptidyl-prolyl cis-trans isomerase [Alphaproteobacteria bacterium]|nr:peptidyl-prolyl cis-trans isomerase [Alphaproteobacteria bacterium]
MKFKTGCALAVLACLCFDANGGALKKFFVKNQSADIETKADAEEQKTAEEATSTETAPTTESKEVASATKEKEAAAPAEKKKIVGDPVVARVGKKEFRRSQILADMKNIPPQLIQGISPDKLFSMLRDQKVSTYLMIEQAKKAGLDRSKEFLDRVEQIKEDLLGRMFLMRELGPKAENESALKARYAKYVVEFKKDKEYLLRHIAVKTEDEAKTILASLAKGEDFSKIAKEKSFAPSKEKDGEEGYIPSNAMPDFVKTPITSLKKGEYNKEAIKTDNGFHIFKVEDIRDTSPLKYEEAKNMLKQVIMQEEMVKMMERLNKQANVEKFNEDGTPITAPAAPSAPAAATAPAA